MSSKVLDPMRLLARRTAAVFVVGFVTLIGVIKGCGPDPPSKLSEEISLVRFFGEPRVNVLELPAE